LATTRRATFWRADRAGNFLELVVMAVEDDVLVIHAMRLRRSTRAELFGGCS